MFVSRAAHFVYGRHRRSTRGGCKQFQGSSSLYFSQANTFQAERRVAVNSCCEKNPWTSGFRKLIATISFPPVPAQALQQTPGMQDHAAMSSARAKLHLSGCSDEAWLGERFQDAEPLVPHRQPGLDNRNIQRHSRGCMGALCRLHPYQTSSVSGPVTKARRLGRNANSNRRSVSHGMTKR